MHKLIAIEKRTNLFIFAWGFALAVSMLFLSARATAQQASANYDQQFVPIGPQTLKQDLLHSSKDPVRMYDLIRRADRQGQTKLAYTTLNQMRLKYPNDAVVLASFCLFDIYDVRTPNPDMARKAKAYLLSTVPPDYKFNPQFQARLAKY